MAAATSTRSNDQLFCREQVQRVNPLFRVSRIFAPPEHATSLLALHALLAAVEESCRAGTDEQVARQKLAWWQQECLGRAPGTSPHPILRLLQDSSGARLFSSSALANLFQSALDRIDAPCPADAPALLELAADIGRPAAELEADLLAVTDPAARAGLEHSLPAAGLLQLVRESALGHGDRRFWWLPLSVQARHGVGRAEAARGGPEGPASAMFGELFDRAVSGRVDAELQRSGPAAERHLQVTVVLQRRQLARLGAAAPADYAHRLQRLGLGDVLAAWRTARRFSRPK